MKARSFPFRQALVPGARGMLGQELVRRLQALQTSCDELRVAALGPAELDITNREAVFDCLRRRRPDLVINAAAYTNVDGCERQVETAMAVNAAGPRHLAEACAEFGGFLAHFSTDFVFDGLSLRPYQPDDAAAPLSVYGQSKWEGEESIRRSGARHLIVRTSWLFGHGGRNFVEAIIERAERGEPLRVVTDQVGRPTFTEDLSDATIALLTAGAQGTLHFANSGHCSWNELAREIVRLMGYPVEVQAMTSDQLDRPARRPAYSVLDTSAYERLTGRSIPDWREALARYLMKRASSNRAATSQVVRS